EHLLEMLATYQFDDEETNAVRTQLRIALETFRGDPFIDAPTSPQLPAQSPLQVHEMTTLELFSDRLPKAMTSRIVARGIRSDGRLRGHGSEVQVQRRDGRGD